MIGEWGRGILGKREEKEKGTHREIDDIRLGEKGLSDTDDKTIEVDKTTEIKR